MFGLKLKKNGLKPLLRKSKVLGCVLEFGRVCFGRERSSNITIDDRRQNAPQPYSLFPNASSVRYGHSIFFVFSIIARSRNTPYDTLLKRTDIAIAPSRHILGA